MKKLLLVIAFLIILGGSIAAWHVIDLLRYGERRLAGPAIEEIAVIAPGEKVADLSNALKEQGLIADPRKFRWYARLKKYDRRIKAGEYALSSMMSPSEILQIIVSGKVYLHRITVPEGYTLSQIIALVTEADLDAAPQLPKAVADVRLLRREKINALSFEGYLFPDTYYFPKHASPETIIHTMVKRFRSVFSREWEEQAEALGMSVHEVVTLASIIEKETGAAVERPLISSVFHNRLKRKMRLASDPTVIYGIPEFDGNLTKAHLTAPTPYNTYIRQGLPPGPIANPGKAALAAALYPADTPFLYFVAKGDRTHRFSDNIADHNRAVRKYQLRR